MTIHPRAALVVCAAALALVPAPAFGLYTAKTPLLDCVGNPTIKPTKCVVMPKGATVSSGSADLDKLHWHRWGQATATAAGCEWGFHHGGTNLCRNRPVTITVYRLRDLRKTEGSFFYTRLRERFPDGRSYVFNVTPFGRGN